MPSRGEIIAMLSLYTGLPVRVDVAAGNESLSLLGRVVGRFEPFSSQTANQPYREWFILQSTFTAPDVRFERPTLHQVCADDIRLNI